MLKKNCKYFPCHKGLEDCTYCYCPIYPCEYQELGKFIESESRKVWDCSNCVIIHKKKIVNLIGKKRKN